MRRKRSQATIYLIFGVIIVLIIIAFFLNLKYKEKKEPAQMDEGVSNVERYIEVCLDDVLKSGIYTMGKQGFYVTEPEHMCSDGSITTACLYYEGEDYLPSVEKLENDLSLFIDYNIEGCTNFSVFEGFDIIEGIPRSETTITNDAVFVDLKWPIEIKEGESLTELTHFNREVDVPLDGYYDSVSTIIKKTEQNPRYIDHIFIANLGMNVTYSIDENTVIYFVRSLDQDEDYAVIFGVKI